MEDQSCQFCPKKPIYTCPKCKIQYCSRQCYVSPAHQDCSEMFYKGLVEEHLKGTYSSEESQKKMVEILKRVNDGENLECGSNFDVLDSDDDEDLADRLKDVDLDDSDAVWSNLTEIEKQEFLDLVKSGKTEDLITPWEPWWISKPLIKDMPTSESIDGAPFMEFCPPVLDCPPLSHIMKSTPSQTVPFNILNVLASYIWTVRLFNGDHQENCIDATEAILTLSPVLSVAANYSTAEIAVNTPMIESQHCSWLCENKEFHDYVKKDLQILLQGPNLKFRNYFVVCSLSDLHNLFTSCKNSLKRMKAKQERTGIFCKSVLNCEQEIEKKHTTIETVNSCIRKIRFFISYVQEYYYKLVLTSS